MLWQQKQFTRLVKGAKAHDGTYFAYQRRIHTCYLGGGACALVLLVPDLDILSGTEVA
jgi:hypothetical protein